MNEQIIVHFQGGLGNQLFQYAAALSIREESNPTAQILSVSSPNKHNHLNRNYVQDLFPEVNELSEIILNDSRYYNQNNAFERWNPKFLPSCTMLILEGYFQYLPAILSVIPRLQACFFPRLLAITKTPRIIPNGQQSGFIHVRRGDYLNHPTYHWSQDIEYYKKGVEYLQKLNPFIYRWYVFSDDIEWCRSQSFFNSSRFEMIEEADEYCALAMMIQCQGGVLVIANSTFSWWAAILGANSVYNPVVYPLKWCGEENVILFPQGWHGF